jgi:rRNA-processing protein FCF1
MKVILDTNFVLIPFTLNIDIFSQFRDLGVKIAVIKSTIQELQYLQDKGSRDEKQAAKMAEQAIEKLNIEIIDQDVTTDSFKNVDTQILDIAKENGYGVATQDKELKNNLKINKIVVYYLRQKKYITRQ